MNLFGEFSPLCGTPDTPGTPRDDRPVCYRMLSQNESFPKKAFNWNPSFLYSDFRYPNMTFITIILKKELDFSSHKVGNDCDLAKKK